ncbi:hypothetical protein SAMD00024442_1_6 [Candidatus Symbiothrix dinenymphae]|nr:hypothetical protein SAMD00024442_1_6 [Candidatus Symbiothrix dinenymphae]
MQHTENTVFDNRYRLIRLLGRGGFSEVWLVEDTKIDGAQAALKIYAPGTGLDTSGTKLFSQEFALVFDLNHTNLLRPTHFDVYDNQPYLLMPYCEKGSAKQFVGSITEAQAWHFLHDVAAGLEYLHSQEPPVIHQDIKPDNILLNSKGVFLITDFGISTKARSTLRRSVTNANAGTVAYMPPERFSEDNRPIRASDVWALGVSVFELITGDVPFEQGGLFQKAGAAIPRIQTSYSAPLKELVYKCLSKETWDRPTAGDIVGMADKWFRGEKVDGAAKPKPKPKPEIERKTQRKVDEPKGKGKIDFFKSSINANTSAGPIMVTFSWKTSNLSYVWLEFLDKTGKCSRTLFKRYNLSREGSIDIEINFWHDIEVELHAKSITRVDDYCVERIVIKDERPRPTKVKMQNGCLFAFCGSLLYVGIANLCVFLGLINDSISIIEDGVIMIISLIAVFCIGYSLTNKLKL